MKKKLLTSLGCLALATVGAIGLVGCGEQAPTPDVRFEAVKGYYMGQDLDVQSTNWTNVTNEEEYSEDKEAGVTVYKMDAGQEIRYSEEALASEAECAHLVAITLTGKNGNVKDSVLKVGESKDNLSVQTYKQRTDRNGNEITENDYIIFFTLTAGAENKANAKDCYVSIDWDGEGEEFEPVLYRFIVEENTVTLAQAPEA